MGLDKNTRKCNNVEKHDICSTRLLLENMRQECGCLPLSLRLTREVNLQIRSNDKLKVLQSSSLNMIGFFMHDE